MMITDQDIAKMCNRMRFVKGKVLTVNKSVNVLDKSSPKDDEYIVSAEVTDNDDKALVKLTIDESLSGNDKFVEYSCDQCDGFCEHCVAVAHQLVLNRLNEELSDKLVSARELEQERAAKVPTKESIIASRRSNIPQRSATSAKLAGIISEYSGAGRAYKNDGMFNEKGVIDHALVSVIPKLHIDAYGAQQLGFGITAGKREYVVRDIKELIDNVSNGKFHSYGKELGFVHLPENFTEESLYYLNIARDVVNSKQTAQSYWNDRDRYINLPGGYVEEIIRRNVGKRIEFNDVYMNIVEADPEIKIKVTDEKTGVYINSTKTTVIYGLKRRFLAIDKTIYIVSDKYNRHVVPFIDSFNSNEGRAYYYNKFMDERGLFLDPLDYASFCGHVLRKIEKYVTLEEDETKLEEYMPPECVIKMYFDAPTDKKITCSIKAEYDDEVYNVADWTKRSEGAFRDIEKEQNVYWAAKQYFNEEIRDDNDYLLVTEDEDRLYEFLDQGIDELRSYGEMFVSDSIHDIKIRKASKVNAGVQIKGNLLELSIDIPDMSTKEIGDILSAYQLKKKYYRMKNGDFIKLNQDSLKTVYEMSEGLGLSKKDWKNGVVSLPLYRANYIDRIVRDTGKKVTLVRSQEFRAVIRGMREAEDSDYEVPNVIKAELRGYQKTGFRWLKTLSHYGFGGILADDMGLGKTLQIITLLQSAVLEESYDRKANTSLIVCPASLVYNWESEIKRFAPELSAMIVVGNADTRKEMIADLAGVDVVVTSYDLLKRDLESYVSMTFDYLVIDEAQYIKNPQTQVSKAVKAIAAPHRFALTGTPIENKLADLWSIFDFCMKGYLFSYKKFRDVYEKSIINDRDEDVLVRLRQMTDPFILRRRKKEVLSDLPDKIEQVVYTSMTDKQLKYYNARFLALKGQVEGMSDAEYKSGQIELLAEITRLRQTCLDPALFVSGYTGGSGKVDAFYAMVTELTENGSSVLVFSQFAEMLKVLNNGLKKEGIKSLMLTGSTSKEERKRLVSEFQEGDIPTVFLISLKAGGTGLNLTAADTVIHLDPWWNVAAQNQATDRAHRIGQDKVVTVIQLVTKNSIEERIIELQNKKKELYDNVIEGEGTSKATLSREEVLSLLEAF